MAIRTYDDVVICYRFHNLKTYNGSHSSSLKYERICPEGHYQINTEKTPGVADY